MPSRSDKDAIRVAAIDVGSNALRFLAVERTGRKTFRTLARTRSPVRLGSAAFGSAGFPAETLDAAVAALRAFRELMEAHDVRAYRAVATAAVRESANGAELIRRAREEAGIELESIEPAEEIRLVQRAVRTRVRLRNREWLLVDVGGGSAEISIIDGRGVSWSESVPLGAVRLLPLDDPQARIEAVLDTVRIPVPKRRRGLIATGGNIDAIARIVGRRQHGVHRVKRKSLLRLHERLAAISLEERIGRYHLRPDRADVIVPAALVYYALARRADADRIHVPRVGVREGIVLELIGDG